MTDASIAAMYVPDVQTALQALDAGPEKITAVDPAAVQVDWQAWVPSSRESKMMTVRGAVRSELGDRLHQFPEVLIIADDGIAVGLFGWETGRVSHADGSVKA